MFFGLCAKSARVKPAEVQDMLANRTRFTLLDVRSREEHVGGHIPGSTLLPLDKLPSGAARAIPDKAGIIVVYCHSGARSAQAVRILTQLGYTDVRNLGGLMHWPFQIVRG